MINIVKTILRVSCFVLAPLLIAAVLIGSKPYWEYPFVWLTVLMLIALLVLLPLWLMQGSGWRRLFKSLGYVLLLLLGPGVLVPQYWTLTPRFVGERFASLQCDLKRDGKNVSLSQFNLIGKQIRYEKISDNAALFSYLDPPVTLLVSTANSNPHCTGYPHSAMRRCTERLRELIKSANECAEVKN